MNVYGFMVLSCTVILLWLILKDYGKELQQNIHWYIFYPMCQFSGLYEIGLSWNL